MASNNVWLNAGVSSAASFRNTTFWMLRRDLADRVVVSILILVIAIDLLFIGGHVFSKFARHVGFGPKWLWSANFDLTVDRSFPEFFEYINFLAAIVFMAIARWRTGQKIYVAIAVVLMVALLDDALEIHETFGLVVDRIVGLPGIGYAKPEQFGELIVFLAEGSLVGGLLIWGILGSDPKHLGIGLICMFLFAVLGAFSVVVDATHSVIGYENIWIEHIFNMAEDGGELLVISAITVFAFFVARHSHEL